MDTRRSWRFSASATEGPADMLDSMLRSPTERNAGDMPGSASAVEIWGEMRVKPHLPSDLPLEIDNTVSLVLHVRAFKLLLF
jgi:hypothetical protein